MKVEDSKTVYVVWKNTDGTEGRGYNYPFAICELIQTAQRLGKGAGSAGGDCMVTPETAFKIEGTSWVGPMRFTPPSPEDQDAAEEERRWEESRRLKREAEQKARSAGLSEADIQALRSGG